MSPLVYIACAVSSACTTPARDRPADAPSPDAVARINALVPPALRSTLVFERVQLEVNSDRAVYAFAAPRGWLQSQPGLARLDGNRSGGFLTFLDVQRRCEETHSRADFNWDVCEPSDWATVSDTDLFAVFKRATLVENTVTPTSRMNITTDDSGTVYVVYAWWTTHASDYHSCIAVLQSPLATAAAAFAAACKAVAIVERRPAVTPLATGS